MFHYNPRKTDTIPVIYLPFTPHIFFNVDWYKINVEYDILYLTRLGLFDYIHKLYSASEDITHEKLSNLFNLTTTNQRRYCYTSKSAISKCEQGQSMIDEDEINTLSSIDRVEDGRFIQLSLKYIVINSVYTYYSYLELLFSYINCNEESDFIVYKSNFLLL